MGYYQKIVETPLQLRIYTYHKQVPSDYETKRDTYLKATDGDKSNSSLNRSKDQLGLLIQCNIKPFSKFITLTTQSNITDRSLFLNYFKRFKEQFKRKYGFNLSYSAVMETQKRGAWHIHMVAYNLTQFVNIKELDQLWQRIVGRGHLDIKTVDDTKNLYKYLIKYLTKEEVALNKKAILNSKNLEQPTIIKNHHVLDYQTYWGLDNPNFTKSWQFYQGNYQHDLNECKLKNRDFEKLRQKRSNSCDYREWHK
jgi:hypothetical protein